jgi:serine phosphatase RsbU (regulator of sigma subunit)
VSLRADSSISTSLEWDAAAAPIPGETVLGDRAVAAIAGECALVAAIDGLGHGPEAAAAARQAASVLERSARQDPAATLRECHRALQATRGAAVSLATIQLRKHEMTWLGVGNVEARLLRRTEPTTGGDSLLLHSGIVGHHLPRLSVQTMKIARGDLLIFATDGIQRDFADALVPSGSCRAIAERILHESAVGSDDALVLVVRYLPRA